MRSFQQFMSICEEVEDKSKRLGFAATIRRQQEGGRIRPKRTITPPEARRPVALGGGKMGTVGPYKKTRSDAGIPRPTSETQQQPEKERGSKEVAQAYAKKVKAERAAAARARAKKGGAASTEEKPKPKPKDLSKEASKLLSTKKPAEKPATPAKPRRKWEHEGGAGMTPSERAKARQKEKAEKLKARKAELIKDFTEKNGRPPKGKEKTQLLGLAHSTVKSGI
jgi:hypothetical protein